MVVKGKIMLLTTIRGRKGKLVWLYIEWEKCASDDTGRYSRWESKKRSKKKKTTNK